MPQIVEAETLFRLVNHTRLEGCGSQIVRNRSSRQGKRFSKKAGYSEVIARDLREVISACEKGSFDVGIIGQALPQMEKLRVTDTLRQGCAGIRIVEFHDAIKPMLKTPTPTSG